MGIAYHTSGVSTTYADNPGEVTRNDWPLMVAVFIMGLGAGAADVGTAGVIFSAACLAIGYVVGFCVRGRMGDE